MAVLREQSNLLYSETEKEMGMAKRLIEQALQHASEHQLPLHAAATMMMIMVSSGVHEP